MNWWKWNITDQKILVWGKRSTKGKFIAQIQILEMRKALIAIILAYPEAREWRTICLEQVKITEHVLCPLWNQTRNSLVTN